MQDESGGGVVRRKAREPESEAQDFDDEEKKMEHDTSGMYRRGRIRTSAISGCGIVVSWRHKVEHFPHARGL